MRPRCRSPVMRPRPRALADYLSLLPSLDQAQKQLNLTYILGSVDYTRLGDYPTFADARVQAPLQAFQKALQQIEEMINQRNQERPPYEFLLPSKIPQHQYLSLSMTS